MINQDAGSGDPAYNSPVGRVPPRGGAFDVVYRLILVVSLCAALSSFAREHAQHVVLIVWDGMRPDFVSQENTPTLLRLAQQGVWFRNHHSTFASSTEVNAAVLATGGYPGRNSVLGNEEYRPQIDPLRSVNTADSETIRQGDALTDGRYLHLPTLVELINDRSRGAVVAGAKTVALLANRSPRNPDVHTAVLFAGHTLPRNLLDQITQRQGRFPVSNATNSLRNDWTTQALVDVLWSESVPRFSLLWLNQPDYSQHETGPGSPQTLASIKSLDQKLARVLSALELKGVRDSTDVLVVSDHGFSTISNRVDLVKALKEIGVKATRQFQTAPESGEVMVVSNGGSVFIYVISHDERVVQQIVRFLQSWKYTGVIFTREAMPGTFALNQIRADSSDAPDILVSLRWNDEKNSHGTPGLVVSDSGYGPGQGTHGSLSPYEMRSLMVAAGPHFKVGVADPFATGNIDVVPTTLWLFGIKSAQRTDGRVLYEALRTRERYANSEARRIEATCEIDGNVWRQYLDISQVEGVIYHDAGNGRQEPLPRPGKINR